MKYLVAFLLIKIIVNSVIAAPISRLERRNIAVYQQEPIAAKDCAEAIQKVLKARYSNVFIITHDECTKDTLSTLDCIVFPGGEKDVDNFDVLVKDKARLIRNYVGGGGRYLGICMGAYIAGNMYFNILGKTSAEQYIADPTSEITAEKETIAEISIAGKVYHTYFYDGPVFEGYLRKSHILATYKNKKAAGIIKPFKRGKVLCLGPHLESERNWYEDKTYWHKGTQYKPLLAMVAKLFE
jgi:glutamine amidotransferase-like uncharacterized protein